MEKIINNKIYHELGRRWIEAQDDPIALLRAESKVRNPWVISQIKNHFDGRRTRILDLGCGAGFLSNALASADHEVVGIDQSVNALEMARQEDSTQQVSYQLGDIRKLTQESHSFDVVCAMDVLEHVTPFECVIAEASRILRPQGLFFFYTFNRNFLSWVLAVKGLEWFVKNTPKNLHVYSMFIKPTELSESMDKHHLKTAKMLGLRPEICSLNFIKLIFSGTVPESFRFKLTPSLAVGYLGVAIKSVDQSEYPL